MAKQDFPPDIDRRRLLVSAVALAGSSISSIEAGVEYAKAASVTASAQPIASAPGVQGLNVCPATARRLLEIERRNLLRAEANLPLLSITKELRRMKQREVSGEFERFAAAHDRAVWEEVLKRRRDAEGNPNWRPNGLEGMCYHSKVRTILWEKFYPSQRARARRPSRQLTRRIAHSRLSTEPTSSPV